MSTEKADMDPEYAAMREQLHRNYLENMDDYLRGLPVLLSDTAWFKFVEYIQNQPNLSEKTRSDMLYGASTDVEKPILLAHTLLYYAGMRMDEQKESTGYFFYTQAQDLIKAIAEAVHGNDSSNLELHTKALKTHLTPLADYLPEPGDHEKLADALVMGARIQMANLYGMMVLSSALEALPITVSNATANRFRAEAGPAIYQLTPDKQDETRYQLPLTLALRFPEPTSQGEAVIEAIYRLNEAVWCEQGIDDAVRLVSTRLQDGFSGRQQANQLARDIKDLAVEAKQSVQGQSRGI